MLMASWTAGRKMNTADSTDTPVVSYRPDGEDWSLIFPSTHKELTVFIAPPSDLGVRVTHSIGTETSSFPRNLGPWREQIVQSQGTGSRRLILLPQRHLTRSFSNPTFIMPDPLRDAVALVTAGSAGLGKATAHALASMHMKVVINYSENTERAEQVVGELCKIHKLDNNETRFLVIKADISKRAEAKRLVHETVAKMGRLDAVFSNHGWTKPTNFTNLDDNVNEEDWNRCFNMNVKSHQSLMHAAREHLETTKGTFITTASAAGVVVSGSSVVSVLAV
jgi:short chain dehydrogenase